MRQILVAICLLASRAMADPVADWEADRTAHIDAADLTPEDFIWVARPIVVFAESPRDPRFIEQVETLAERPYELAERDVVVILDTDTQNISGFREALRPRGFMIAILAKDGSVAARKPAPRSMREITRQIDSMPLRRQETGDLRGGR